MAVIEDIVFTTTLKDPVEISEGMMNRPGLPMLGCQHAYIAAGALLAAIKNEGSREITREDITEVFKRIKMWKRFRTEDHHGGCNKGDASDNRPDRAKLL